MLIGGEWRRAASAEEIEVVNPSTEEVVASVPSGEPADVEFAVATAKGAFPGWAATDVEERATILAKAAELIEANVKALAAVLTSEQGKPIAEAIGEVKQIEPASSGGHLVLKHVPDPVFILNPAVYASACQCFDRELSLWRASDQIRLMLIATFIPCEQAAEIRELSLMPLTWDWLPGRPIASESASRHSPRRTQGRARQQEVAVTPVGGAHLGGTY